MYVAAAVASHELERLPVPLHELSQSEAACEVHVDYLRRHCVAHEQLQPLHTPAPRPHTLTAPSALWGSLTETSESDAPFCGTRCGTHKTMKGPNYEASMKSK